MLHHHQENNEVSKPGLPKSMVWRGKLQANAGIYTHVWSIDFMASDFSDVARILQNKTGKQ